MIQKGIYKHYKGNLYGVIGLGKHSETREEMVIYRSMRDESQVWVRPLKMWNETIIVDGKKIKRFELVEAISTDKM